MVVESWKESGADMLINYVPVGSEQAARYYAGGLVKANVGFINAMPTFIVSDPVGKSLKKKIFQPSAMILKAN